MRYLFLLLPVIFAFSSLGYARDMEDDLEVVEEISEEDNEQNYNDQEDSDEENEEESDVRQSASARSKRENVSVYGDSSRQKFERNQHRRTRADLSIDDASAGIDNRTTEIVQHEARFDHVTHEIVIENEPFGTRYLNKIISVDQESPAETEFLEFRDSDETDHNVTHEFIIETEPFEPRYLNDEYWAENEKDKGKNVNEKETSDSMEDESRANEEETDNDD